MRIFEFKNYRKYLKDRMKTLPSGGRGELTKIAQATDVHSTMISHIMNGKADFSLEQTLKLADHLALNAMETDFLVSLVQLERAGDPRAREYCLAKVNDLRKQALNLSERLKTQNELSEEDRAFYYSSWVYSHVRMLTAIDRFQTFEALKQETGLPPKRLRSVLDFLVSRRLCVEKGAKYIYGNVPTYIEASSPLVARHHLNWRQKVQERYEGLTEDDLVFTYPTVISAEDYLAIREKLTQFIEEFKKTTAPSASENVYCLTVDWLKISRG